MRERERERERERAREREKGRKTKTRTNTLIEDKQQTVLNVKQKKGFSCLGARQELMKQ